MSACKTATTTTTTSTTSSASYPLLSPNQSIADFVGQSIRIKGKISSSIYQHMMKGSFAGEEQHIYIDYNNGKQLVGYYTTLNVPNDTNEHIFSGRVSKISGAGKGGGTHTEYYIDLEKID